MKNNNWYFIAFTVLAGCAALAPALHANGWNDGPKAEETAAPDPSRAPADKPAKVVIENKDDKWVMTVDGKPFIVRGVEFSPDKVGTTPGESNEWMQQDTNENRLNDSAYESWVDKNGDGFQDVDEPTVGDFELLKEMGCNAIRIYHPSNINKELLRDLYNRYGIRVIMGNYLGAYTVDTGAQWDKGTDYTDPAQRQKMLGSVKKMVEEYKDEPFVLLWMLGNENDSKGNTGNSTCTNTNACKKPEEYAKFVGEACDLIKKLDPNHPVGICNAGYTMLPQYAKYAKSVDIIGLNAYKGVYGFGSLWNRVKTAFDRPVLITEYGTDSYDMRTQSENEDFQALYHKRSWVNILENTYLGAKTGNALGGVVYCWLDKWWLCGSPKLHDTTAGSWVGPTIDNCFNDEWLGIAGQEDGRKSPFLRHLKKAYYVYRDELWKVPDERYADSEISEHSMDMLTSAAKSGQRYSMYKEAREISEEKNEGATPFSLLLSKKVVEKRGSGRVHVGKAADGWQLIVDGKPYIVKGMEYSPCKVGVTPAVFNQWMYSDENGDGVIDGPYQAWADANRNDYQDFDEKSVGDFQLLKEMGCNTIRIYESQNVDGAILKNLYEKYGIMSIMGDLMGIYTISDNGKWVNHADYTNQEQRQKILQKVREMVLKYKDEPYVLMWMLGNENDAFGNAMLSTTLIKTEANAKAFAKLVGEAARLIKKLDKDHPVGVCTAYYRAMTNYAIYAQEVDVVGVNAYTGAYGFATLWNRIKFTFDRPVLITEYGVDCYDRETGEVNENYQVSYHKRAWEDIVANSYLGNKAGNAIGGVIYSWLDKWWVAGDPETHDVGKDRAGRNTDGYLNGEWYGVCSQGDGTKSPFERQLRKVYSLYKDILWSGNGKI